MANTQLVVLVGVFLVSILLSFLYVTKEGFAPKKGGAKKAAPKKAPPKKAAAKKGAATKKAGKKTAKASKAAKAAAAAAAAGALAGAAAEKALSGTSEDGAISGVPAKAGGMKFSELIQSLIAYTPARGAGGAPYGTALGVPATVGPAVSAAGGAELVNEVRKAVRDEVKVVSQQTNAELANRATKPTVPGTPNVSSPGLRQGAELRNPSATPYGAGQAAPGPVSVVIYPGDYGAQQPPQVDMSQFVPRTNVYGLA